MTNLLFLLIMLLLSGKMKAQDVVASVPVKKANIVIETFDNQKYKGRLQNIGSDHLLLDARGYNSLAHLNKYYLRPDNSFYKIDLEYLKSARVSRGRALGHSVAMGASAGGLTLGLVGNVVGDFSQDDGLDGFVLTVVGGGIGAVLGGVGGAIGGLFTKRKIVIKGDADKMYKLTMYFSL